MGEFLGVQIVLWSHIGYLIDILVWSRGNSGGLSEIAERASLGFGGE